MSAYEEGKNRILIVDDDQAVRDLIATYLQSRGFEADTASSGDQALAMLSQRQYDLVLSDLHMPGVSGIGLMEEIARRYPEVGVVIITGCEDLSMAVDAMKRGALDYVTKPFHLNTMEEGLRNALERHRRALEKAGHTERLERQVRQQTEEVRRLLGHLHEASEGTLDALVAALDAREHETQAHSKRVSEYAVHLARELGVRGPELEVIHRGAMLHDIGKIGISDTILLKPAGLDDAEWSEMRRHPEIGYWILNGIEDLRSAAEIVLAHHERFDGRGYPRRLTGDQIPLGARIFSVVDSFDVITSDRPYHRGKSYEAARQELAVHSGTQFDPAVVDAFLRVPSQVWSEIRDRTMALPPRAPAEISSLVLSECRSNEY